MALPESLSDMSPPQLLEVFEAAPARLDRALHTLPEADETARPIAGKWSIREIVAHLTDAETVGATRFRFTLAEPGSRLPVYDQAAWARRLGYQDGWAGGAAEAARVFAVVRGRSARLLRHRRDEDWRRRAHHPEWGDLTLRERLELYADHGERHLEQILERRARLGHPLEPLLAGRLY